VFEVMDGRVDDVAVLVVDIEGNLVVDCWDVWVAVAVVDGVDVVCCVIEVAAAAVVAVVLDVAWALAWPTNNVNANNTIERPSLILTLLPGVFCRIMKQIRVCVFYDVPTEDTIEMDSVNEGLLWI
jgi:hypothetical protein